VSATAPVEVSGETPMHVRLTTSGAIVHLDCRTIRERQAMILNDQLHAIARRTNGRIALCMASVGDLSSACLNSLLRVGQECQRLGGRLAVYGLAPELVKVFRLARVDRVVSLATGEADAVRLADGGDLPANAARSFLRSLAAGAGFIGQRPGGERPGAAA
jgi:anti-anti-sigma regulatory factor